MDIILPLEVCKNLTTLQHLPALSIQKHVENVVKTQRDASHMSTHQLKRLATLLKNQNQHMIQLRDTLFAQQTKVRV